MKNLLDNDFRSELVKILIDNTPIAYIIMDDQYRIHYINDNFLKLRKLDWSSTMGEICYNISNGGVPCKQCAVAQSLQTGQKAFIARKDVLPDGSVRFIDDYAIPLQVACPDGHKYVLEIMVNRTEEMLARKRRDDDYDEIVSLFSNLLEAKDTYTATHSDSVRRYAGMLASALQLSPEEIFEISIAASLHDIGKVNIADTIINKPAKLTDEEFGKIKQHPVDSFYMIQNLSSFNNIKNIVKHHHERFDGKGYPEGLAGEDISLGARIVAIADTYDAMTSTRSYRKALSHDYAINEIKRMAGTQFDPYLADVFANMEFTLPDCILSQGSDDNSTVERILPQESIETVERQMDKTAIYSTIDQNSLLQELFNNTPCGYVLMDTKRNVLFASQYFLDYMGLGLDEVVGLKCFEAGGNLNGKPCRPCAIERALKSGKVEYMRQEQPTRNGQKIFDLFGMPLADSDGKINHVIEIIIDRTDEINLDRQREQDFSMLIAMLGRLLEIRKREQDDITSHLAEKIDVLQTRLDILLSDKQSRVLRHGGSFAGIPLAENADHAGNN